MIISTGPLSAAWQTVDTNAHTTAKQKTYQKDSMTLTVHILLTNQNRYRVTSTYQKHVPIMV